MEQMPHPVKRAYDATTRRAQSAETRQRIVDSARFLLLECGYRATTVAAVANGAGVSIDTVYEPVGRKPMLLREVIEQSISGTDRVVVAEERDYVQVMQAQADPARKLSSTPRPCAPSTPEWRRSRRRPARCVDDRTRGARGVAGDHHPAGGEHEAACSEPPRRRRSTQGSVDRGSRRHPLDHQQPRFYVLFVQERGWTPQRYEAWLADTWARNPPPLFLTRLDRQPRTPWIVHEGSHVRRVVWRPVCHGTRPAVSRSDRDKQGAPLRFRKGLLPATSLVAGAGFEPATFGL